MAEQPTAERKPVKRRRGYSRKKVISEEIRIAQRRRQAAKLQLEGFSYRDIGEKLKCSVGTVHSDLTALIDEETEDAREMRRKEQAVSKARLDRAIRAIWPMVLEGDLDAIHRLERLEHRRAQLLGLDAPVKTELSGPEGAPVPIDARTDILQRLASITARRVASGGAASVPSDADAPAA